MAYESIYDEFAEGWYDYNPIHAIWYLLVQSGIPESMLHEGSFLAASITIYNEGKGISGKMSTSHDVKTWIVEILGHIGGALIYGTDGKFHMILIRDDYVVEDLPVVNENVVLEEPMFDRRSWPETRGELQIQYNKRVYPPSGIRYYQEAIEVLRKGHPFINYFEEAIEVIRKGHPYIWLYQEAIEVIHKNVQVGLDDIAILWE